MPDESGNAPFQPLPDQVSFPGQEEAILKFWQENDIFKKSLSATKDGEAWVTYDGPPGTNGKPHIGHMMQSALKDLWPRFWTMRGKYVFRKAGWDTHGLPIEQTVEKVNSLGSKADIESFGIQNFVDACRSVVFSFKKDWEHSIHRIGRFLDLEQPYATLENEYIESDWWTLKRAHERGLLYKGFKILPISPKLATPLSNHEATSNYKDVNDLTCVASFPVKGEENVAFLAWTTTPWTLIGNIALALGPEIDYVYAKSGDKIYILAESRLENYAKVLGEYEIVDRKKGSQLEGIDYEPLWDFHQGLKRHNFTIADDYVTDESGTGIVHIAMYGEDDFRLIQDHDLPHIQHVQVSGVFTEGTGSYSGRYFKEDGLDVEIIKDLASKGKLFHKERMLHAYPFCPRTDEPLIYFARKSWFLSMSKLKDELLTENGKINWFPSHIKAGRFGDWLENVVDWAISRERYWGSPLPIWICDNCQHQLVVGSIEELNQYSTTKLSQDAELHKPAIDDVKCKCPSCDGTMSREPDVLDCWFNAGIMPWGQHGYPSKPGSEELFGKQFPADFICEGLDQTRGWFYTLLATSLIAQEKSSFKNVICTGLVLDETGLKMSKSKGNIVDPQLMFDKYGADAARWQVYTVHPGNNVHFGEGLIKDVIRLTILPIWNTYGFLVTYANIDKWKPTLLEGKPAARIDRWILSELYQLRQKLTSALENFDTVTCTSEVASFLDNLTNWYVRRNRRRFWKGEIDGDKTEAYQTLYTCLYHFSRLMAPFMPFLSENLYQNLFKDHLPSASESIHLDTWPEGDESWKAPELVEELALVRAVIREGNSLRKASKIKVRQPLQTLSVYLSEPAAREYLGNWMEHIQEELNIKEVSYVAEGEQLAKYSYKPNLRTLGPKCGPKLKQIGAEIVTWDRETFIAKVPGKITIDETDIDLVREDVLEILAGKDGTVAGSGAGFLIALHTDLSDELKQEGFAREFISQVQKIRKNSGFDVEDRISIKVAASDYGKSALENHSTYIDQELLSTISFSEAVEGTGSTELNVEGEKLSLSVEKNSS